MARINLKSLSALQSNLKLKQRTLAEISAKFKDSSKSGANKPAQYSADQEYTDLFALGPVVEDLAEAIKAIEEEIEDIHQYIEASLGNTGSDTVIPDGGLDITNPADGDRPKEVITIDDSSGDVTVKGDSFELGDTGFTITTDADGNIIFN